MVLRVVASLRVLVVHLNILLVVRSAYCVKCSNAIRNYSSIVKIFSAVAGYLAMNFSSSLVALDISWYKSIIQTEIHTDKLFQVQEAPLQ